MFHIAHLLLGSNQGDRQTYISDALQAIGLLPNTFVFTTSSLYETEAWGKEGLPPHINVAAAITTTFAPQELLTALQKIENDLDRVRQTKWGERTIDIDIIFYGQAIIATESLKVPHPLMQERRFVLEPLNEIASDFIHPVFLKDVATLLESCKDTLSVKRIS